MASPPGVYALYYRQGCHLCEDMIHQLQSLLAEYENIHLELRNVDDNPEWFAQFNTRVPVLLFGRDILSEFFLDELSVRQHLNGQQGKQ